MGNLCKSPTYVIKEMDLSHRDIPVKTYTANSDCYYDNFDKSYNFLKFIDLSQHIVFASKQFKDSDPFTTELSETDLDFFVNKYIIGNPAIDQDIEINTPHNENLFRNFIISMHKWLSKAYLQFFKYKRIEITRTENIKQIALLTIGILYCHSEITQRIDVMFNILAANDRVYKCDNTQLFFFYMFLIPTYISLGCIYSIYGIHDQLKSVIREDKYNEIMARFSVKSVYNLTEIFLKNFFDDDDKGLTYSDFKKRVVMDDYSWVLTQSGIRHYLEKYNFS
jgi:hypothetical protein